MKTPKLSLTTARRLLLCLALLSATAMCAQTPVTVVLDKPGKLKAALKKAAKTAGFSDAAQVDDLTLAGTIDAKDLQFFEQELTHLRRLDLSGVTVDFHFFAWKLPTLRELRLPVDGKVFPIDAPALTTLYLTGDDGVTRKLAELPVFSRLRRMYVGCRGKAYPEADVFHGEASELVYDPAVPQQKVREFAGLRESVQKWGYGGGDIGFAPALVRTADGKRLVLNHWSADVPQQALDEVTEVASGAFADAVGLKEIALPRVVEVPKNCFAACKALVRAEFAGATRIGANAFHGERLETLIIPKVERLDEGILATCPRLRTLDIRSLAEVGRSVSFGKSLIETFRAPCLRKLTTCLIWDTPSLRHLDAPRLEAIESYALRGTGLEQLTLAEGLAEVGASAFATESLREISLPASLRQIDAQAFAGATGLQRVAFRGEVPPSVTGGKAGARDFSFLAVIPRGSRAAYEALERLPLLWTEEGAATEMEVEATRGHLLAAVDETARQNVVSLTIRGHLDDDELQALAAQMPNLRILDVAEAFIHKGKATVAKEEEKQRVTEGFLEALGAVGEQETQRLRRAQAHGHATAGEVAKAQAETEWAKEAKKEAARQQVDLSQSVAVALDTYENGRLAQRLSRLIVPQGKGAEWERKQFDTAGILIEER